jgi:glycosyltransferase involved in cell wall biosynthesis
MNTRTWICCQLGAREHYAIPRALHGQGALDWFITDAWMPPKNPLGAIERGLRERYHADLAGAQVKAWNAKLILFELQARSRRLSGWPLIIARNRWFQSKVVAALARLPMSDFRSANSDRKSQPVLFSYSYTALEPFRWAKSHGWRTVLGQIDPALIAERIVQKLHDTGSGVCSHWEPAPPEYWDRWRAECALANRIIVNSTWSREALESEGIPGEKITVIPLAYTPPAEAIGFQREYPATFTSERPLRVLFLGQVNLLKGIAPALDAVRLLANEPVEFRFVGPRQMTVPADLQNAGPVGWTGPVSRKQTPDFYRWADVFLFPTLSDGFGLTQLEAQAWKLPVICSRYCGDVVNDGANGLRLDEVSGESIASALRRLLSEPWLVRSLAQNSGIGTKFSLEAFGEALQA